MSARTPGAPTFLARLAGEGDPLVVTFLALPRVEMVTLAARAGFDGVIVDLEHGPFGIEAVPSLVAAARAASVASIVRVADARPAGVGAALDAGADAVMVPHVADRTTAAAVVDAGRFPPLGNRGANPWVAAGSFGADPAYFAEANTRTGLIAIVEGTEGVAALDEIVAVDGLSAVFVGPFDLSCSVGVPGQTAHPEVVRLAASVIARAGEAGLGSAIFAADAEAARRWLDAGARMIALGVDVGHVLSGLSAARAAVANGG